MKYTGFENNFGHSQAFIKRFLNWLKGGKKQHTRNRDNCPKWVKQEAIDKANEKRVMRAEKKLALAGIGAIQMLVTKKKKRR